MCQFFIKLKKNLVGPTLVSFGSKTQEQDFFKRCSPSLFQVGRHPNFAQKKRSYYERFQRKIPDKRKNVRRVFHWTFTLWVQDSVFFSSVLIGKGITDLQSELP